MQGTRGRCLPLNSLALLLNLLALLALQRLLEAAVQNAGNARLVFTTRFTRFASTRVQILTQQRAAAGARVRLCADADNAADAVPHAARRREQARAGAQFTCFTRTKVQTLTLSKEAV